MTVTAERRPGRGGGGNRRAGCPLAVGSTISSSPGATGPPTGSRATRSWSMRAAPGPAARTRSPWSCGGRPRAPGVFPEYDLAGQAQVQNVVAELGIPVAAPVELERDESWVGSVFMVMPAISGYIPNQAPAFDRWIKGAVGGRAAGALGGVLRRARGDPPRRLAACRDSPTPRPDRSIDAELARWAHYLELVRRRGSRRSRASPPGSRGAPSTGRRPTRRPRSCGATCGSATSSSTTTSIRSRCSTGR